MNKLYILSQTIKAVYGAVCNDQERPEIIPYLTGMMKKPIIRFNEAYTVFINGLGTNGDAFDRWLNLQFMVITLLGDDQDALKQLPIMFKDVLKTTEGGEVLDITDPKDYERYSFIIALAFRIYLDDLTIPEPDKEVK